jgi:hypothetical protein
MRFLSFKVLVPLFLIVGGGLFLLNQEENSDFESFYSSVISRPKRAIASLLGGSSIGEADKEADCIDSGVGEPCLSSGSETTWATEEAWEEYAKTAPKENTEGIDEEAEWETLVSLEPSLSAKYSEYLKLTGSSELSKLLVAMFTVDRSNPRVIMLRIALEGRFNNDEEETLKIAKLALQNLPEEMESERSYLKNIVSYSESEESEEDKDSENAIAEDSPAATSEIPQADPASPVPESTEDNQPEEDELESEEK